MGKIIKFPEKDNNNRRNIKDAPFYTIMSKLEAIYSLNVALFLIILLIIVAGALNGCNS